MLLAVWTLPIEEIAHLSWDRRNYGPTDGRTNGNPDGGTGTRKVGKTERRKDESTRGRRDGRMEGRTEFKILQNFLALFLRKLHLCEHDFLNLYNELPGKRRKFVEIFINF